MKKSMFILCAALSLSACSFFSPYKVPVEQGNLITKAQLSKLKVGMSEPQVTYLLGNPMVRDTFKPNEWHYLYTTEYATPETPKSAAHKLTVIFANGVITKIKK